ncbi:MAG: Hvo_1808 family surface protein [Euryarchaeota archaeon]|nr:Hvo_1808 family surface protein [Euryarchaeota archaeon]
MTRLAVFLTTLLLLSAGVAPAVVTAGPTPSGSIDSGSLSSAQSPSPISTGSSTTSTPQVASESGPDSQLGCVDGVCHDDELGFDEPTNLTDEELDRLVDRSMARVEELRGEQFDSTVDVEVRSRESFRADSVLTNSTRTDSFQQWNDQVWEALFVVGEDQRSAEAIDSTVGAAVNGFYMPSEDQIVIVSSTPDEPTVSERTLVHELVHAWQDQQYDLTSSQYRGATQDADLAVDGVVEGEAGYLEARYEERCAAGQWECLDEPATAGSSSDSPSNQGILLTLLQPYSDGPAYIHEVRSTEGWDGVGERVASPPETTRTIIHGEPPEAASLDVADESTDGWQRYPDEGVGGAETVGEASIYVMFWYQAAEYGADTVDTDSLRQATGAYDQYNYSAAPSDGWVGDKLYPYERGEDDGYVWTTQWESTQDVSEFVEAYGGILDAHDATETDSGAYVVSDGSFSGAYAVDVTDTRVTIVHAPTEEGLFELRPALEPTAINDSAGPAVLEDDIPGFGVAAAVAALVAFVAVGRRLR